MAPLKKVIRRYTTISATLDILRRRALPLLNPEFWDDRNDRYFMARYKQAKNVNSLYALCAARCSETYHHWKVFTGAADGACIELHRDPLEAALATVPGVRFGEVDYFILDEIDTLGPADLPRLPFIKRSGFTDEEEYRIVLESGAAQAASQSIELPLDLIGRIYLNPWLPKSIAESVIETIHDIRGCKTLSVQRSHLIDNARWKEAGDRVVGIASPKPKRKLVLKRVTPPAKMLKVSGGAKKAITPPPKPAARRVGLRPKRAIS